MTALLPSLQAGRFEQAVTDYLRTTFALTERDVVASLDTFLADEHTGIFRGPYLRTRMPFRAASRAATEVLEWYGAPYPPHGHQLAAFDRLSSAQTSLGGKPLPTLVTTGTGSGKTEAFLFPILDHVRRAKRQGVAGMKALILYPMNALANDQARRLAHLLANDAELAGITAGLYTGQAQGKYTQVTAEHLITDRAAMRAQAPDILLTNYKMLDQLLLRSHDQPLWQQSATSLRYLVLDEFHTYDGAQGTDVAMLLRRLGLVLKQHWPSDPARRASVGIDAEVESAPLGLITPAATSATLGGEDSTAMVDFANTVFGAGFDAESVVGETRQSIDDWIEAATGSEIGGEPRAYRGIGADAKLHDQLRTAAATADANPLAIARAVLAASYTGGQAFNGATAGELHDAFRRHPDLVALVRATATPASLDDLESMLFDRDSITAAIAALSQIRAAVGFAAPSIDVNSWIRAVSRIDRVAGPTPGFRWADDGRSVVASNDDAFSTDGREALPAIYCRHCGRSGWGVAVRPTGEQRDLDAPSVNPRRLRATSHDGFRALIYAPREADEYWEADRPVEGFGWFGVLERRVHATRPQITDDTIGDADSNVLPVLWLQGLDVEKESKNDTCPACGQVDGIRFVGAAIATLLSVVTTAMFGDAELDRAEKKALVFTDSVQDAAHRAGFVQSRAHVFGLRNAIRRAIGDEPKHLGELVSALVRGATVRDERYRLLGPDVVDRDNFRPFWEVRQLSEVSPSTRRTVTKRLAFDIALEFGLQSSFARTLERTSSATAEVDAGAPALLERLGRQAIAGYSFPAELGQSDEVPAEKLVAWSRGVLEHMRSRGAIEHDWLKSYIGANGERWLIWGGRPKHQGMPAFPPGRTAPAFPRRGKNTVKGRTESGLDDLSSSKQWYARFTARVLGVPPEAGGQLTFRLLEAFAEAGIVNRYVVDAVGGTAFGLAPERVIVRPTTEADRAAGNTMLKCSSCDALTAASPTTVSQLAGVPCAVARCDGALAAHPVAADNYYRRLYEDSDMRRVIAREHTGLLDDKVRLKYEQSFKSSSDHPEAPNVLVATPTLEMGIDIGDLSAVFLASLPDSVASYVQRVGRAGRLTGSALAMAFVPGRHDQLAWYHEPLDLIAGEVSAPATYLNAVEILKRQFIAAVIDRLTGSGEFEVTGGSVALVLSSTAADRPLGILMGAIREHGPMLLDAFIAAFERDGEQTLSPFAIERLREWASGGEQAPALAEIAAVSTRFVHEREELGHRIQKLMPIVDELEHVVAGPAPEDEAKTELANAKATLRMLRAIRKEREDEHWVSALERYGLLPNYTLLDDRVLLDVGVSWVDADTNEFKSETFEYSRDAMNAIREFAPGATFYAQGLAIDIDAVETGANGEHVHEWVICPECGYSTNLTASGHTGAVGTCPRCGTGAFADAGQRMQVLELEAVSAQVRRDEAIISDSDDERRRRHYVLHDLMNLDEADVESSWFDEQSGLGVKYARKVTLHTLNLGLQPEHGGGAQRLLGGASLVTPLFRVCRECGQLDEHPGENSWGEHRPWCSHRKLRDEDPVTIALSRTLETQGMLIRLPQHLATGDDFALPSLSAALRLGLREIIGGDPNHLDLARVVDISHGGEGSATFESLLVHDRVPGGTGYLVDHATVAGFEAILLAALRRVESCECQHEGRSACHRCLLPHAVGPADRVWRQSAVQVLRELLGLDRDATDDAPRAAWQVVQRDPGVRDRESALEKRFREAIKAGTKQLDATLSEQPGTEGNTVTISLPHGQVRVMRPQVNMGSSKPDFVFESKNAAHGRLAVFVDGYTFHATNAINRVADDCVKRASLRRTPDTYVISVTHEHIAAALAGTPDESPRWIADNPALEMLGPVLKLNAGDIERLSANPIRRILEWIADPAAALAAWRRIAPALPLLLMGAGDTMAAQPNLPKAALMALQKALPAGDGGWQRVVGQFAAVTRLTDATTNEVPDFETALVLSDQQPDASGFRDSWREFLEWSNVLGFDADRVTVASARQISAGLLDTVSAPATAPVFTVDHVFTAAWQAVFEDALDDEISALVPLRDSGVVPAPELGEELGDGIPVMAHWPEERLVYAPELDERSVQALTVDFGWHVVTSNVDAVIAHFSSADAAEEA